MSAAEVEPIAVVGLGCRFAPDITSPGEFWTALMNCHDATGPLPPERWEPYRSLSPQNTAVLRRTPGSGAYLSDIAGFDAEFFGISPREAEFMDPQQRMLLEVVWEALEHAGIRPADLAGTSTGVFLGSSGDDYLRRMLEDLPRVGAWSGVGGQASVAAGRISYLLDSQGTSLAVDTACSSSLTALHLACQSLRLHEVSTAIVAGVNVMAAPGYSIMLHELGAISADGRSKPFSADADGYGRGEGVGVLVLQRRDDAERDANRMWAVIRGTSAAQDGRTTGIMSPSRARQEHVLRRAYRAARVVPETIDYIEGHGTGTAVGDPVEVEAIAAAVSGRRGRRRPCLLGSVKGNIGHLEAGAGVSGVIKTVLALWHAEIPPTLHCETLNPAVAWDALAVEVVRDARGWPVSDHPRRAGVSAFGYGGSLAHIVLEQAPDDRPSRLRSTVTVSGMVPAASGAGAGAGSVSPQVFPVSAASATGLRETAGRLADWLEDHEAVSLRSIGYTLARRRDHRSHRAVVVARTHSGLARGLRSVSASGDAVGVVTGRVAPAAGHDPVWVFSGHGAQWPGMGRGLLRTDAAFASVVDSVTPIFVEEMGFSPREAIEADELGGVDRIQAMLFVVHVALAAVWQSYGLRPSAIIGHSVGEIAAAVVAGALGCAEGARLVCRRSLLLRRVAGAGGMAMVNRPFDDVAERVQGRGDVVAAIAASAESTVVSGDRAAVGEVCERWRAEGLLVRMIDSDVAFHSPQVADLGPELAAAAQALDPRAPRIPLYSTALADPRSDAARDGAYWATNLCEPVRFAPAIAAAIEDGHRSFVEVSAHPVVTQSILETLNQDGNADGVVAHTLRRQHDERDTMLSNLGVLHCGGVPIAWERLHREGEVVELPGIAWHHRPYWLHTTPHLPSQGHDPDSGTVLGSLLEVSSARPGRVWHTVLDEGSSPGVQAADGDDEYGVASAVLVNTLLVAAGSVAGDDQSVLAVQDVSFRCRLARSEPCEVQVVVQGCTAHVASRAAPSPPAECEGGSRGSEPDSTWVVHTAARLAGGDVGGLGGDAGAVAAALRGLFEGDREPVGFDVSGCRGGFGWTVEDVFRRGDAVGAWITVSPPADTVAVSVNWAPVLDAAFTVASLAVSDEPGGRVPGHIASIAVDGRPAGAFGLVATRSAEEPEAVDVSVVDESRRVVGEIRGLRYVAGEDVAPVIEARELVHELAWRPRSAGGSESWPVNRVVVVGEGDGVWRGGVARLGERELTLARVAQPSGLETVAELFTAPAAVVVAPGPVGAGESLADAAHRSATLLVRTVQQVTRLAPRMAVRPRLWCLTSGVRRSRWQHALAHAPVWGVGRVIGGEHPDVWGGIVDLDRRDAAELGEDAVAGRLAEILRTGVGDDVIAMAPEGDLVARLVAVDRGPVRRTALCRPDGAYVVTGGVGALGLRVARWLVLCGARRLILVGRRGLPPRQEWAAVTDAAMVRQIAAVRELEALGADVEVVAVDIGDRDRAVAALGPDARQGVAIRGVVHAAGTLSADLVDNVDPVSLRAVMRPKVDGGLVLHDLFPPGSVDFFVLFSSSGPLIRESGLSAYGAANAFLDALAAHRRSCGDRGTTSFAWAAWRGLGMAGGEVTDLYNAEAEALGVADITEHQAFDAWQFAYQHDVGLCSVMRVLALGAGVPRLPLLSELAAAAAPAAGAAQGEDSWAELSLAERREVVLDEVRRQFAREMRMDPGEMDERRSLADMGLDSVMTVAIRARLQRRFRVALPATIVWEKPTVEAIAEHLVDRVSAVAEMA